MSAFKFEYLKSLRGQPIPRAAYRVMVEIWNYSNVDGENSWPGEEQLAKDCCMCVRSVQRAIAWLLEYGYLLEVSRGCKYTGHSVYRLGYGTTPDDETEPVDLHAETPTAASNTATYPEPFEDAESPAEVATGAALPIEMCWQSGCGKPAVYDTRLCAEHERQRCDDSWNESPPPRTERVGV
ncbi:helix-turn-helix domain-containing protein [Mycobacterium colombiense]|uniref:helix-turn-helix domain-containing protein n=1 Tax=Mycobacterium colombiense TaxID=339268 RepID=UPI000AE865D6|nr:helix-turn-helix domain-containing protein [Mycobacterium colombiense]